MINIKVEDKHWKNRSENFVRLYRAWIPRFNGSIFLIPLIPLMNISQATQHLGEKFFFLLKAKNMVYKSVSQNFDLALSFDFMINYTS